MSPTLIAGVHLSSRMYGTPVRNSLTEVLPLRDEVLRAEARFGHRNTILIGDFNLDPFDMGLSQRRLIWGTMDLKLARRLDADDDGVFYNPMWSRLGDGSRGPAGTFFCSSDGDLDLRFHTFDQVLIRPELAGRFHHDGLVVIDQLGGRALTSDNGIPVSRYSDHLPLCMELEDEHGE